MSVFGRAVPLVMMDENGLADEQRRQEREDERLQERNEHLEQGNRGASNHDRNRDQEAAERADLVRAVHESNDHAS